MKRRLGKVYLVGAGPGDPGLITYRAIQVLERADVVLYDHLANDRFLSAAPQGRLTYVGKKGNHHAWEQKEINRFLIREAKNGKNVVRLKGGDPFVFGRGGEEAEALASAKIPFEVVPGITSPIAAPAYAGIPVTHRDFADSVTFVTGHGKTLTPGPSPAKGRGEGATIVFLMGVTNLTNIVQDLICRGLSPKTPVAVIEWGTLPYQKVAEGTLKTIVQEVKRVGIKPPAVTVVGEVVTLRKKLKWYEKKPLFGRRILVTRSRKQSGALAELLEEKGALVYEIPTIEIQSPSSWKRLDRSIQKIKQYDWLIFTSVNGVDFFFERLLQKGKDLRDLKGIKIAAIGPATAEKVKERGIRVDTIAQEYKAEGLVKVLAEERLKGKRILIPRAREAREVLVKELRRLGGKVDLVEAYRAVVPKSRIPALKQLIDKDRIDLLTFASSSTVDNFMKMVGKKYYSKVRKIPAAVIGPITAQTARKHKLKVKIQPKQYTIPALVHEVQIFYKT